MNDRKAVVFGLAFLLPVIITVLVFHEYFPRQIDNSDPGRTPEVVDLSAQEEVKADESPKPNSSNSVARSSEGAMESIEKQSSVVDNERHSEHSPFSEHVVSYLSVSIFDEYNGSPQMRVREYLKRADLPELYRMLEKISDTNGYLYVLAAICTLEEDKERALSAVQEYLRRPVDWQSFRSNEMAYEDWVDRYIPVRTLGYINYPPAHDFLASLLDIHEATNLVLEWAGPEEDWVSYDHNDMLREALESSSGRGPAYAWIEHCVLEIGRNAALGLAMTGDELAFRPVEDAYGELVRQERVQSLSVLDEVHKSHLGSAISRYRFFKDMGWEEGWQILARSSWESQALLFESYYPEPEGY